VFVNRNGALVPGLEKYLVTRYKVQHVTRVIERPRAFDRSGKEIDAKRLAALLAKPTVVLQSVDGKPVVPFSLRTVKEGTVTLSMPPVATGAPAPPRDDKLPIPRGGGKK